MTTLTVRDATPADAELIHAAILALGETLGTAKRIAQGENCTRFATDMPSYTIEWTRGGGKNGTKPTRLDFQSGCMDSRYAKLRTTIGTIPKTLGIEPMHELRFEVRDTGIGIAPEAVPRLFTAFTQVHEGMARRYGGTGLGLAICKHLVEKLGGCIGLDSVPGQGSCFWFELDMARGQPAVAGSA